MPEVTPRVLVVDDERFYREAIEGTLVAAGFRCEIAEDGGAALAAAAANDFSAVVLDLGLPGMSGVEVLRRLVERCPAVRVVVLATQAEHEAVLEALRLGACDYLAKPLHDEELGLAVKRAVGGYAVESRWAELRQRICELDERVTRLNERAAECRIDERIAALGDDIAAAVSAVLGATRTSLMLMSIGEGVLRVVGAAGSAVAPEEMDPATSGEGVAGRVFSEAAPCVVDDVENDDRFIGRSSRSGYRSRSFVVVPVPGSDGPIGVLCATDREDGDSFPAPDLALMRILAREIGALLADSAPGREVPIGGATSRAGEGREIDAGFASYGEDLPDDAELARAICEVITTELEPDRLIQSALAAIARLLPAAPVALYLIDNQSGVLVREGQVEGAGPADRDGLECGNGLTGMVVKAGHLVATDHPEKDPRFEAEIDTPADGSIRPLICVPLKVRGKVLGVLRVFPSGAGSARARTAEVLAASMSAAVRSVLLYRSLLDSIDEVARARRANRGRT